MTLRYVTYLSLIFGGLAALSCLNLKFLLQGLICSLIGFLFSIIHVFITTKDPNFQRKLNLGHIGMLLSSVPVIYVIFIRFFYA